MPSTISPINEISEQSFQHQKTTINSKSKRYEFTNKNSSLVSVNPRSIPSNTNDTLENDDPIRSILKSNSSLDHVIASHSHGSVTITERPCSLTQMLLTYAQKETDTSTNLTQTPADHNLNNIFNVLELHFNTYADDQRQIYFEGIFQLLHDFKEQITEYTLIETMKFLQIDPLVPCSFENFVLILCHLPPLKQDHHAFLDVFNELDHNKDSYITFEDIQFVLPKLTSHLDEKIIRAAIQTIDTDHDNGRLSYFDFVTSLIALQECKLTMKMKTTTNENSRVTIEQRKE